MNDFQRLFLQAQANASLLLCFILTIGIVCCATGAMFFNVLKHSLRDSDWFRYLAFGFEYIAWAILLICLVFDVLFLLNVFRLYGG